MDAAMQEKLAIIETVQNWAVWRDAGDWERFKTVWHDDGWMSATWFQGPALAFIEVSKSGFEKGVSILHFLGGSAVDLKGTRAVAQTKMTINQRATVDNVEVDVVCTGRFYDFFEKRRVGNGDAWKIVRRQPIYEKDRMDVVDPNVMLKLDVDLLGQFPEALFFMLTCRWIDWLSACSFQRGMKVTDRPCRRASARMKFLSSTS